MIPNPLSVCFLWHHHQPPYHHPTSGRPSMPWVRLHATKAYTDMAAICERMPEARVTFNLVPSLLEQLQRVADGVEDDFARLTRRPAAELNDHDKQRIVDTFFSAPYDTMVAPWPRYRELHRIAHERSNDLTMEELRDLQVWFNLAWCGPTVRREHVGHLIHKGRGFSSADKLELLEIQRRVAGDVVGRYRRLNAAGNIELTCSPYYHPILPLLCSSEAAQHAFEGAPLPNSQWAYPEDAAIHLTRARDSHHEHFGIPPAGIWPSEGAISPRAVVQIANAGFRWLASDEALLRLCSENRKEATYSPWDLGHGLHGFFRDHALSDKIGFVYANWSTDAAVDDFVGDLVAIHQRLQGRHGVVTIALDGENCWEHYPDDSPGFLEPLYRAIARRPELAMRTFSDALEQFPSEAPRIPKISVGSWIDGSLATWVGHPKQNKAWDALAYVRSKVPDGQPLPESLLRAQASDWFWWLGPNHQTPFEAAFTKLFMGNLHRAAHDLDIELPSGLFDGLLDAPAAGGMVIQPTRLLSRLPIDGQRHAFFRWRGAGRIPIAQDAMARSSHIGAILFGFDEDMLWLRLELTGLLDGAWLELTRANADGIRLFPDPTPGVEAVRGQVLEAAIPRTLLGAPHIALAFIIRRTSDDAVLERLPRTGWTDVSLDVADLLRHHWYA